MHMPGRGPQLPQGDETVEGVAQVAPPTEPSQSILELTKPEQTHPAAQPPTLVTLVTPGRIVHYNAASGPMPAIVTHTPESVSDDFAADRPVDGAVHLVLVSAMLHPHGTNTLLNVPEGDEPGMWRWPGRS